MARDRRSWTAEQKLQAVLGILRGEVSLLEQARRIRVAESQLYRWRDQANAALLEAFSSNGPSTRERELEQKVAEMERLCGKQAVEIELLKKSRLL
jgi:transposase-like protein